MKDPGPRTCAYVSFPNSVQFITTLVVVDRLTGRGCCCAVSEDPLPPFLLWRFEVGGYACEVPAAAWWSVIQKGPGC